jgi:acyl-coenzyme A synthetase/AMP-(fatty) acid ligase
VKLFSAERVGDFYARGWWSRGDVVGIQLPNVVELAIVYLAAGQRQGYCGFVFLSGAGVRGGVA